ncbi:MAG: DUF1361 domain-containing protein [Candidatus Sericytochromatia bacterium]
MAGLLSLCGLLVVFRIRYTGTPYYGFLLWNLFLAVIPLLCTQLSLIWGQGRWRKRLLPPLLLWLLFFPNAPYVVTDLMHLGVLQQMPRWYDPLMVFVCALSALWAGFLSLRDVEFLLRPHLSGGLLQLGGVLTWGLCGVGIYLGRVLRWNSWDAFHRPGVILRDALLPFLQPATHLRELGLMALCSLMFGLLYALWRGGQAPSAETP